MEFLETHAGKDAKAVWKNDIDLPVKEEASEESTSESEDEKDEEDESKKSTGEGDEEISSFHVFLFCWIINELRLYIL